jgi:tetratricopeptide (TPR) repeat protein
MHTHYVLRAAIVAIPLVMVSSGCAMFTGKQSQQTNADLAEATPQGNESYTALRTQVRNLRASDKLSKAREVCRKLIEKYPDRSAGYHQLALVADRQKRYQEAQELYAQALRIEGANSELFNDLGYSYYLNGKMNKAESALAKAVELSPHEDRYRINLGLAIGQQQRLDDALEHFRLAGSEADAQYNLAFVYATQDKPEKATKCFQLALASDPTHEKSLKALRSFEKFESDPNAAAENAQFTVDSKGSIPFVEDDSRVIQASGQQPSGRAATAALHRQAQSMMNAKSPARQL